MTTAIRFRAASEADCSHLAVLADAATRRLVSFAWSLTAQPGQSVHEVGREAIRTHADHFSYFANWQVAEHAGRIAGAVNSYQLPTHVAAASVANSPAVLQPLNALKAVAGGTWYIAVAAVFPEFRNQGVGQALLAEAETMARANGHSRLTLMVGSFNHDAHRLYLRRGFTEWERRSFMPFPGSDPAGDWILMVKDLS